MVIHCIYDYENKIFMRVERINIITIYGYVVGGSKKHIYILHAVIKIK